MSFYGAGTIWAIKQSLAKVRAMKAVMPPPVNSDVRCSRCKNFIWEGGGVYFRPKDEKSWMPFCREDCARLHVGKDCKIYSREEYAAQVVHQAIKSK